MKKLTLLSALVSVSFFASGCDDAATNKSIATETRVDDESHDEHDHSAHDHSPPHGGHLIELGRNHEYHAELVDDHKTESITIYMLDSHMEPLTLNQSTISLVLTAGDNTQTFELTASQEGGSTEFSSNDEKMMAMIDEEEVTGKLRVTIDGKPFSGTFEHHGHDHDEGGDSHDGHNH